MSKFVGMVPLQRLSRRACERERNTQRERAREWVCLCLCLFLCACPCPCLCPSVCGVFAKLSKTFSLLGKQMTVYGCVCVCVYVCGYVYDCVCVYVRVRVRVRVCMWSVCKVGGNGHSMIHGTHLKQSWHACMGHGKRIMRHATRMNDSWHTFG